MSAARAPLRIVAAAATLLAACGAVYPQDREAVPRAPTGDPAMAAGFARAAASFDAFLVTWRAPPPGAKGFTVKIGLRDTSAAPRYAIVPPPALVPDPVEWFWTSGFRRDGDGFAAEISNDADLLHNVLEGATIDFTRQDIGDWMCLQDGKIVGNFTTCPALAHASAAERRQMKEQYGIDCD
jgi:uncharacterized protein YegJ (DUF2314 family)